MKKYYFIDEDGNKKQYMGKVINDYVTEKTYGIVSHQEFIEEEINLEFHNEILAKPEEPSYFSYIDKNGQEQLYTDLKNNINRNIDNSYFFNKVTTEKIDLKYYKKIDRVPRKFTYIDNGQEVEYKGKCFYDKFTSSYYFYKK